MLIKYSLQNKSSHWFHFVLIKHLEIFHFLENWTFRIWKIKFLTFRFWKYLLKLLKIVVKITHYRTNQATYSICFMLRSLSFSVDSLYDHCATLAACLQRRARLAYAHYCSCAAGLALYWECSESSAHQNKKFSVEWRLLRSKELVSLWMCEFLVKSFHFSQRWWRPSLSEVPGPQLQQAWRLRPRLTWGQKSSAGVKGVSGELSGGINNRIRIIILGLIPLQFMAVFMAVAICLIFWIRICPRRLIRPCLTQDLVGIIRMLRPLEASLARLWEVPRLGLDGGGRCRLLPLNYKGKTMNFVDFFVFFGMFYLKIHALRREILDQNVQNFKFLTGNFFF